MDRSLFIAMSGATQTLRAQTANANNLANTQTTGFKSDMEQFRSMPVFGEGYPTRVYAMTERPATDISSGALQTTGNDLDIAIKGEGFFAVKGADGKEAYTRRGDLRITPEGILVNGAGQQLIGENGAITIPPAEKITISKDGFINIVPMGAGNVTTVAVVDQIKVVNPPKENIEKLNDGLFHLKSGTDVAEPDPNVDVLQGVLEGSNVNAMSAMVEMIELSKNFELQTKVMKTADETSAVGAKLMQMIA